MSNKKIKFPPLSPEKKKDAIKGSLTLFLVLFVISGILSGLSALIAPVISDMYEDEITEIFERIVPADAYEEIAYDFSAANKVEAAKVALLDGKPVGYCVEMKAREGDVDLRLIVGVSLEGKAIAVEVVEMSEEMEYIKGDISTELLSVLKSKNESLATDDGKTTPSQ
ncbi:MAG: hypothetical protein IIV97_04815, partial [Oscillospiraceae bacterium]|nr:hypothetical protein [Oscillospiraceae bacterium]